MKERQFFYHLKISVSFQTTFIHLNARVIFSSDHHRLRNRNCDILFKMAENWPFPQILGGWSWPEILRTLEGPRIIPDCWFQTSSWTLCGISSSNPDSSCLLVLLFCSVQFPSYPQNHWEIEWCYPAPMAVSTTCHHSIRLYWSYLSCLHVHTYFHWGPRRNLSSQVSFIEKL